MRTSGRQHMGPGSEFTPASGPRLRSAQRSAATASSRPSGPSIQARACSRVGSALAGQRSARKWVRALPGTSAAKGSGPATLRTSARATGVPSLPALTCSIKASQAVLPAGSAAGWALRSVNCRPK